MFTIQGKQITIAADEKKAAFTITLAGGQIWTMHGRPYVELTDGSVYYLDEAQCIACERKTGTWHGYGADYTLSCGLILHTLVYIEDNRDDLVVIVAGYTELMEEFVDSNPGLRSRFNKYILFDDYTAKEMTGIFDLQCKKSCYTLTDAAKTVLAEYFSAVSEAAGEFGNARGVRNTFEKILTEQANRIAAMEEITKEDLMCITEADVRLAAGLAKNEDPEI